MFRQADYFILIAALVAFVYSVVLWFGVIGAPNKEAGLFVALWVPSVLSLGAFAKLSMREKADG